MVLSDCDAQHAPLQQRAGRSPQRRDSPQAEVDMVELNDAQFAIINAALARRSRGHFSRNAPWEPHTHAVLPIGTPVAELVVNGVPEPWLLDTGANQSVVSRTFAERLGVTPLPGVSSVGSGVTGRQSSLRVAVLPTMQVGGATLTNVVLPSRR
jgi:hypothetical protein